MGPRPPQEAPGRLRALGQVTRPPQTSVSPGCTGVMATQMLAPSAQCILSLARRAWR